MLRLSQLLLCFSRHRSICRVVSTRLAMDIVGGAAPTIARTICGH